MMRVKTYVTLICYTPHVQHKLFLEESVPNTDNLSICIHILMWENKHVETFRYFEPVNAEKLRNADDKMSKEFPRNSIHCQYSSMCNFIGICYNPFI
jgi:hypothetical protein